MIVEHHVVETDGLGVAAVDVDGSLRSARSALGPLGRQLSPVLGTERPLVVPVDLGVVRVVMGCVVRGPGLDTPGVRVGGGVVPLVGIGGSVRRGPCPSAWVRTR